MKILMIAVGGGLGAVARYGVSVWIMGKSELGYPLGTLVVNVLGCFLIGFGAHALADVREELRIALLVGLLGGFTTFSTFAWEGVTLMQEGRGGLALLNLLLSNVLGLCAAWAGYRAAMAMFAE